MRRLIAITTLGLVLSTSVSFASDYMGTYTKPIVRSEVRNDIKGGNVEKDFTSFYTSSKLANTPASLTTDQKTDDEHISVFGVQISLR
ncbi:MAG: hypothetical protein ACRENF_01010, partial [Thermodesulfobacteriota bacterium]